MEAVDLTKAFAQSAQNEIDQRLATAAAAKVRELTEGEREKRIQAHREHFLRIINETGFVGGVMCAANEQTGYSVVAFGLSPEQVSLASHLIEDMNRQSFGAAAVKPMALTEIGG